MLSNSLGVFLDVVVAAAAVLTIALLLLIWSRAVLRARQPQIVIGDLENRTGHKDLEQLRAHWNDDVRERYHESLGQIGETLRDYLEQAGRSKAEKALGVRLPKQPAMSDKAKARQDQQLQTLMSSLQASTTPQIGAPLQVITDLVTTQSGTTVSATLRARPRKSGGQRLGITVEMADVSGALFNRHTFWQLDDAQGDHIEELIDAVTLWVAVEFTGRSLVHGRLRLRRKRYRGLVDNLIGLVYQGIKYEGRERQFLELAAARFKASMAALPGEYHPGMNLGLTYLNLALCPPGPEGKEEYFALAERAYKKSIDVLKTQKKRSRRKSTPVLVHQLEAALAFAQLKSTSPSDQGRAFKWLAQESERIERDPRRLRRYDYNCEPHIVYNVACLWAVASKARSKETWRERARKLLGVALVKDPDGYLWGDAATDPDLSALGDTDERSRLLDRLRAALPDHGDHPTHDLSVVERIVEKAVAQDSALPPRPAHERAAASTESRPHRRPRAVG